MEKLLQNQGSKMSHLKQYIMPWKKLFPKHFKDLRSKMFQNNFFVKILRTVDYILVSKLTINLSTKFRTSQNKEQRTAKGQQHYSPNF